MIMDSSETWITASLVSATAMALSMPVRLRNSWVFGPVSVRRMESRMSPRVVAEEGGDHRLGHRGIPVLVDVVDGDEDAIRGEDGIDDVARHRGARRIGEGDGRSELVHAHDRRGVARVRAALGIHPVHADDAIHPGFEARVRCVGRAHQGADARGGDELMAVVVRLGEDEGHHVAPHGVAHVDRHRVLHEGVAVAVEVVEEDVDGLRVEVVFRGLVRGGHGFGDGHRVRVDEAHVSARHLGHLHPCRVRGPGRARAALVVAHHDLGQVGHLQHAVQGIGEVHRGGDGHRVAEGARIRGGLREGEARQHVTRVGAVEGDVDALGEGGIRVHVLVVDGHEDGARADGEGGHVRAHGIREAHHARGGRDVDSSRVSVA